MKNAILLLGAIAILGMVSCNKDQTAGAITYGGGTLTYDSTVYNATSCIGSKGSAALSAAGLSSADLSNQFTMNFKFLNGFPDSSATYTVVNGHDTSSLISANQVAITGTLSGTTNATLYSTGGGGTQTVRVTLANGLLTLTGSGIEMSTGTDSASLSLHLNQTQ